MSMISAGRSVKGVETLPCRPSAAMVDHRNDGQNECLYIEDLTTVVFRVV